MATVHEIQKLKLTLATAAKALELQEEALVESREKWRKAAANVEQANLPLGEGADDLNFLAETYRADMRAVVDHREAHGKAKREHDGIVHPINPAFPGFIAQHEGDSAASKPEPQNNPLAPMPPTQR